MQAAAAFVLALDADGSGSIDRDELLEADTDGDGLVDKEELKALLNKYHDDSHDHGELERATDNGGKVRQRGNRERRKDADLG